MKVSLTPEQFKALYDGYNYEPWLKPQPYGPDLEGIGVYAKAEAPDHQLILIRRISSPFVFFLVKLTGDPEDTIIYEANLRLPKPFNG